MAEPFGHKDATRYLRIIDHLVFPWENDGFEGFP